MYKYVVAYINNSVFYNSLRHSIIFEFIFEKINSKTSKTVSFLESFLKKVQHANQNMLAFDIGANKGNKTQALLKLGFKVLAVEPELASVSTLRYRFSKNKNVQIVDQGVSDTEGTASLHITAIRSGLNTINIKWKNILTSTSQNRWKKVFNFKEHYNIQLTTLAKLIKEYGTPYYIKIDVEGHEKQVICGLNVPVNIISFEANLPEFITETIECIVHIEKLSPGTSFNYAIDNDLALREWISAKELVDFITTNNKNRYMEIICDLHL